MITKASTGVFGIKNQHDSAGEEGVYCAGDLCIDMIAHQVNIGTNEVNLTLKEYELLMVLIRAKNRVITRAQLLRELWRAGHLESDRTINVHICRLRKKIESDPEHPKRLLLVRGVGYKLTGN